MNRGNRIIVIILSGALLLSGFAFGRWVNPSNSTAAEGPNQLTANGEQPNSAANAKGASEAQAYLNDYKSGYSGGYRAGLTDLAANSGNNNQRPGYSEGFKKGFADGYQVRINHEAALLGAAEEGVSAQPVAYRRTTSRRTSSARNRRGSSKLKTALTIAAPAAIGAGVGALAGGKKGAGVGALLGGGGGALYHLLKKRD
jgi:hypothetical protein